MVQTNQLKGVEWENMRVKVYLKGTSREKLAMGWGFLHCAWVVHNLALCLSHDYHEPYFFSIIKLEITKYLLEAF
jgi:hypothetical protein